MLYVDINNKTHVNIIISHADIIYQACRGQKYATIGRSMPPKTAYNFIMFYLKKKKRKTEL